MELRNSTLLLAFCTLLIAIRAASGSEGRGYIFTSPRTLKVGSNNQLQLLRYINLDAGSVRVRLFYNYTKPGDSTSREFLKSENVFTLKKGQKETYFYVYVAPFKEDYVWSGRLEIDGIIGDEKISGTDSINYATARNDIIVIQTDKHKYKPGQTVRWRILHVNKDLQPTHQKNDVVEVYVEDPKGTRLFQTNGVYLGNGLTDSHFVLADEPLLGYWTITLNTTDGDLESASFEVAEYQLPKFEVKITYPSVVLANAETVPITVCANFTYGKPVTATLNLNVSLNQYYYYDYYDYDYTYGPSYRRREKPVDHKTFKLDGCYTYDANIPALQRDPSQLDYYSSINVIANVVQEGTGVQINATENIYRTTYPLNLAFDSGDYQRNYFKPGLPYNGKVKVTNSDGTPAPFETVQLSYIVTKQRVIGGYLGQKQVQYSKNFTADAKGVIKYTIPPQNEDAISISLEAQSFKYPIGGVLTNPSASLSLSPFYSPSRSYIQLANVDETIPCGTKKQFKVLYTTKPNSHHIFHYEVLKQGKVVHSGSQNVLFTEEDDVSYRFENNNDLINHKQETLVPSPKQTATTTSSSSSSEEENCPAAKESRYVPPVGEIKIPINVDYTLSDSFTLLVYYVKDCGETVADSMKFTVDKCLKNKVNFKFTDAVKQPGQNTNIKITTSPNSLCGVRVIDKSVNLLDSSNQLTKDRIFDLIDSMDVDNYYSDDLCYSNNPHQPGLPKNSGHPVNPGPGTSSSTEYSDSEVRHNNNHSPPDSSGSTDDSYSVFQQSGFLVISNLRLFTRTCEDRNNYVGPIGPPMPFGLPFFRGEAAVPLADGVEFGGAAAAVAGPAAVPISSPITTVSAVDVRKDFPETWLFELETVGSSGVLTSQKTLPDTITEWEGDAVCLNTKAGLGFSDMASIRGFQLFFISYTLPNSAVRGEEFTVVVSISSYANGALPIKVSLDDPVGYEVDSDSINKEICVPSGITQNLKLQLKGTHIGKINITVRAETAENSGVCGNLETSSSYARDAISQSLDIEAEGFPVEKVESILFCPLDKPGEPFKDSYSLNLPDDAVEDSERAFVDVSGNMLGKSIQNLNSLVRLPTGCGEQNLVKFVPNYLALDYLKAIGELDGNTKDRAISNLNAGYQRELFYRHYDGSFSAFGEIDGDGSMFLTAFVIRSFYEAKRYIYIDDSVIQNAQQWIENRQKDDGCFPDVGHIIDAGLQGGIEKDNTPTTVTAYVLASLLISNYQNQKVIDKADECLKNNPPKTPYEIFLVTYAEVLAGKKDAAQKRINDVKPLAVTTHGGEEKYFNPNGTNAIDLETVAYAVLSNLGLNNDLNDILGLVRNLAQNLNPYGGYYSTQDTCVGLSALSGFAKLVYGKPINIDVSISGALEEKVKITDDNKLLVQREQVTKVPGDLDISASGSGCGLIQVTFRFNSIKPPNANKYYIKVLGLCSGKDCSDRKVSGTVRYLPGGRDAGFSIVVVKMQTGIYADRDSVKQLPGANGNSILRADIDGNDVVLYFNRINNNGENFEFQVNKEIDVKNPQPGSATVTNYYDPEISTTTTYTFDDTKETKEDKEDKKE